MNLIPTIGLEIHVELKTKSKMFCECKNEPDATEPNSNICPICLGFPGTLPVANKKAIDWTIKTALALNCKIATKSKFDRKNYFYPDLPKSYQISQYDLPIASYGWLKLKTPAFAKASADRQNSKLKTIKIQRVHLEEDTAKLVHPEGKNYSLVDFNRSGIPLMEIVTEPVIETAKEAKEFCQNLRLHLRYLRISSADMEKGQMRCEVNISLQNQKSKIPSARAQGEGKNQKLGTKVEIKNLNSFRAIEKAINYEIKRQINILKAGDKIIQETRGWHDKKQITFSQRTKETAPDYRYFPEPDLPSLTFKPEYIENIKAELPELPDEKYKRLTDIHKIAPKDAQNLISDFRLVSFFEQVAVKVSSQKAANWILTELLGRLKKAGQTITENRVKATDLIDLINAEDTKKISRPLAKEIFDEMMVSGKSFKNILKEKKIKEITAVDLEKIVQKIFIQNQKAVEDFKKGKKESLQFLIGQVMRETRGAVDPGKVKKILEKKLK